MVERKSLHQKLCWSCTAILQLRVARRASESKLVAEQEKLAEQPKPTDVTKEEEEGEEESDSK